MLARIKIETLVFHVCLYFLKLTQDNCRNQNRQTILFKSLLTLRKHSCFHFVFSFLITKFESRKQSKSFVIQNENKKHFLKVNEPLGFFHSYKFLNKFSGLITNLLLPYSVRKYTSASTSIENLVYPNLYL